MITASRRFQFCAGHRVYKHESKCAHPHGHNYVLEVTMSGQLDNLGRVIDFSVIKKRVGNWIENFWDHGFIVYKEDVELKNFLEAHQFKLFWMNVNPTAENMAIFLMREIIPTLLPELLCVKVKLWETENCFAEVYDN